MKKNTKSALLLSVVSIIICCTMLLGTTMAWFTDSVTSSTNIIKAGNLDVEMYWLDGKSEPSDDAGWKDASEGAIFEYDLWEPGYTEVRHIKISNEGTLALKYELKIIANGEVSKLADVIDVYYTDPAEAIADRTQLTDAKKIGTLTEVLADLSDTASGNLEAGEAVTVTLALKMQESAGNEYMNLSIGSDFSVQLLATQLTSEEDSFDNQYDAGAEFDGVNVPEDAVAVSNFEEFTTALAAGGNYEVTAPFTVEGVLTVSADTAFYNTNPANVLTFAQNARLKTAENADLALYGVKINGGGSFEMVDGVFTTDATTKYNNDAILMASAGSTLTLGEGTVIENVISTTSAVAWAKGTVDNRATIILEGATVRNCVGGSGTVIDVDRYGDVYIEEGTVITGNVSYNQQNHGIIRIYNDNWDAENASTLTINGGELTNNYFSANGMIGLYYAKMTMNGGTISGNSWYSYNGKTNGFYCVVYVHSNAQFIMNGGEISGNTITDGAINAINSAVEGAITFNGGTVTNNSNTRNENKDALAAVCYPGAVATTNGTAKVLVISENANVTGTIYSHANLNDQVDKKYIEISEFFAN